MRADQLLVERGLAPTRSSAQRLIRSGVQWRRDGASVSDVRAHDSEWQSVEKNGQELAEWVELRVLDGAELRYVSRAGLKLEGALLASGLNPEGLHFLDIGQSTGGFTDCLLQKGAAGVVGLDVGHDQLAPALSTHPKVIALQGVNARDAEAVRRALTGHPSVRATEGFDGLVMDVSFISQTLVLPAVLPWVKPGGVVLSLVKPQFELSSGELGKGGLVVNTALYDKVRTRLTAALSQLGCTELQWLDSPILGGDGNREFFIWARVPNKSTSGA